MPDEPRESSDEEKLAASVALARAILNGGGARIPIEQQLLALAHTVIYLNNLRKGA